MLWKNELKVSFLIYANCVDTLQKVLMMKRYFWKGGKKEATRNIRRRSKYHFAECEGWCSSKTQQPSGISLNYIRKYSTENLQPSFYISIHLQMLIRHVDHLRLAICCYPNLKNSSDNTVVQCIQCSRLPDHVFHFRRCRQGLRSWELQHLK